MKPQTILFFGRSGSGKGTQTELLSRYITSRDPNSKVLHIEIGQKLREFATQDNHTARLTKKIINEGGLLPVFMPTWTWSNILIDNYSGKEHLILEGLSRHPSEAQILDSALKFYECKNPCAIVINVSREWATDRLLKRGRSDDSLSVINRRMDWYESNVAAAIEYFRQDNYYKVLDINGEQSIELVNQEIISSINWQDD